MVYSSHNLYAYIQSINSHILNINGWAFVCGPVWRSAVETARVSWGGDMHGRELYGKYRRLIEKLADERRCSEVSLTALRALLQEFQNTAASLGPSSTAFVCDELADQLEHEALRSTGKHRRDVLLAAVKALDGMTFPKSKP
jgi:hypothetical protein